LPGQIGSINRAIVLLGLNAVKNIAIAASLAKLFRGGRICPGFDAREFWMHSIGTATASRLLSAKVGLGLPDEAFLAGLIHDIGVLVEIQARRPKFVEVIEKLEKDESLTLRQAEDEIIGANHELFGAALCRMWKFPASFAYVTGFHHHPMDLQPANRTLAAVVHIAHTITAQAEIGYGREVENKEISPEVLDSLKLSMQQVDEVIGTLAEATEEARTLFPDVAP
ncbi:MAG: HDOD domain-containing protein, partial [Phycisphaeraceae bacterium]